MYACKLYSWALELIYTNAGIAMIPTVLMEMKGVQRDRSTLSQTPDKLQVLLITVVVVGQWRDWVLPAEVLGHERNSVLSALQLCAGEKLLEARIKLTIF